MQKMKLVMVGNGMVGQRFLEQLVARSNDFEVTTFCEEPRPAYDRVQLTSFFSGKSAADLNVVPERFFQQHAMTLRLNDSVLAIDAERKVVRSARYREVPYDKLVIATGSYPFVPPVSGRDRRDCFVYRTIEDLEVITATAARAKVGTVIGGGLLGLEAAKALQNLGLETHIVEFASRLMAVQLDDSAGRLLRRKIEALGAKIHLQKTTREIVDGETRRHKLIFADGTNLETDLIVFSAGIRPRDELARAAGLAVGERGGIQINSHCQTTNPDIYAVGECALWEGRVGGIRSLSLMYVIAAGFVLLVSFGPQSKWFALAGFVVAMLALGMGNGAVFQLVPQRFRKEIGVMTGMVGMAGGVGGFYLASSLGYSKQLTGSYQTGLLVFAALTLFALIGLSAVKTRWRTTWGAAHLTPAKV